MKKFAKICALSLSALLFPFGLSACGGSGSSDSGTPSAGLPPLQDIPSYSEEKTMWIGAWDNPPATEEAYKAMQDCGITMVYVWNGNDQGVTANLAMHFELGEKYGIKVYPTVTAGKTATEVSVMNEQWGEAYDDYPALGGFNYMDEPGGDAFDGLGVLAENHNANYASLNYYVNMYPVSHYSQNGSNATMYKTYDEYIADYCNKVVSKLPDTRRILSFDHYCMSLGNGYGYLSETWLQTVETIADYALQYDADTVAFLLTTQHHNYLAQTYESLRFQANVYMAYGVRGLSHFTYSKGSWGENSPVDDSGLPRGDGRLYYAMAQLDGELLSWDDVYLAFDWKEVMQVYGSEEEYENEIFAWSEHSADSISFVEEVTATKDTLIGHFEDASGNKGLMVTNFEFPEALTTEAEDGVANAPDFSGLTSDVVTLKIPSANAALVIVDGEMQLIDVQDETITLELEPAGAAFVIPLNLAE